jgi:hypothetical protein
MANVKIGNSFFRDTDLYGKTIYVTKDKTRFRGTFDSAPSIGITRKGEVAGKFLGMALPNPSVNRSKTYMIFGNQPSDIRDGKAYSMIYNATDFSEKALREQKIPDVDERLKEEEESEKKWYQKLNIGPWALAAVAIYAFIKKSNKI